MKESLLELLFAEHIKDAKLPRPEREYKFVPKRHFRADFAWIPQRLLVEIEGGTYTKSRHTTGTGFHKDCQKYNEATLNGWRLLRFDSKMVTTGEAIKTTMEALKDDL